MNFWENLWYYQFTYAAPLYNPVNNMAHDKLTQLQIHYPTDKHTDGFNWSYSRMCYGLLSHVHAHKYPNRGRAATRISVIITAMFLFLLLRDSDIPFLWYREQCNGKEDTAALNYFGILESFQLDLSLHRSQAAVGKLNKWWAEHNEKAWSNSVSSMMKLVKNSPFYRPSIHGLSLNACIRHCNICTWKHESWRT